MNKSRFILFMVAAFILAVHGTTWAYTPPSGSPLANKVHPRLYFISDSFKANNPNAVGITPSEMRTKLVNHFKSNGIFQAWIDLIDASYSSSPPEDDRELPAGAINYAFAYLVDPGNSLMASNFAFGHTRQEYVAKAVEYAKKIISDNRNDGYSTGNSPYSMSVAFVYDWAFPDLSLADKQLFADWWISISEAVRNDSDLKSFMPYNIIAGSNHKRGVGALAFWGDPLDSSGTYYATKAQELLDEMNQIWLVSSFGALENLHQGANWQEGYGYGSHSFIKLAYFAGLARTALNTDYFNDIEYFKDHVMLFTYSMRPRTKNNEYYLYRHILDGESEANSGYREHPYIYAGMLQGVDDNIGSLGRWLLDRGFGRKDIPTSQTLYESYSFSPWMTQVMYRFIWSNENGLVAKSPSQLNFPLGKKLGLGQYMFRTGFESPDDTLIGFQATDFILRRMEDMYASFTVEKFGTLILDPAGPKSGNYSVSNDEELLFHSSMSVYDASETDAGLGSDNRGVANEDYPDPVYEIGGNNDRGDVLAEDINNGLYDYVKYDWSRAWSASKVDLAIRDFLYIRGPLNSEYVVVVDRMNTVNSNFVKRTTFWMPFQPQAVDGSFTQVSAGNWTSNNTTMVSETNTYPGRNNHGRLFMKSLLPDNPVFERIGGPGHEFDDLEGNSQWKSNGGMTDELSDWFGSYRIQIRPSQQNNFDTFLNVMQIGDSNSLNTMADIVKVESSSGQMAGAHIKDSNNQWLVLFAKLNQFLSATQYVLNGTGTVKHFITDLDKNSTYDIQDNGTVVAQKSTGSKGTIQFNSVLSGSPHTFKLVKTGASDTTPPNAPINLKVIQ